MIKRTTKLLVLPVLPHPELYDIGQGLHERDSVSLSDASLTGRCKPEMYNQYTVVETVIRRKKISLRMLLTR